MPWRQAFHLRSIQVSDGITTVISFVISYFVWKVLRENIEIGNPIQLNWSLLWLVLGFSVIWVIVLDKLNAYTYQRFTSLSKEFSRIFKATLIGVLIFFAFHFLFRLQYIPRMYILVFTILNFGCLILEKFILFNFSKQVRKKGKNRKKVLVIGTDENAQRFIYTVEKNIGWGLDIIGFLSIDSEEKKELTNRKTILGNLSDINKVLNENVVDEVIICVSSEKIGFIKKVLEICEIEGVQVRINSDFFGYLIKRVDLDYIYGLPIVSFYTSSHDEWALYFKRFMDLFISIVLLILLSPLFLLISVLIRITSDGPIFYKWNVVGLNKKPFTSWKFRTMVENADQLKGKLMDMNEMQGPVFKINNDPRITKLGRFLRKFSLDELPQLWSVLKGDMSLVGPRPPLQSELTKFNSWHRRKLSMKPGITCLWQIRGRNMINNFDDWARLDLLYIDNWSIWQDLKILFFTAVTVFRGTGR